MSKLAWCPNSHLREAGHHLAAGLHRGLVADLFLVAVSTLPPESTKSRLASFRGQVEGEE